jgi:hypothetical protein
VTVAVTIDDTAAAAAWNPPGLSAIGYRVGTYATFRHALLRPRPGELALAGWHGTARDDLAVQLLEWWAYLADIVSFYNERALTEALLRTAEYPEDLRHIVRLLGYRPRPGIGATGVVAALSDSSRPVVLPRGFPIQGPDPGGAPPQVFELDEDVEIGLVGRPLPASARFPSLPGKAPTAPTYAGRTPEGRLTDWLPARDGRAVTLKIRAGAEVTVPVDGSITNVGEGDVVVVIPRDWDGTTSTAAALVHSLEAAVDQLGRPITNVTLRPGQDFPSGLAPQDCKILKPTKSAHLWLYHERYPGPKLPSFGGQLAQGIESVFDPGGLFTGGVSHVPAEDAHVLTSRAELPPSPEGAAHLEGITRGINPGDPVLFEQTAGGAIPSLISKLFDALGVGGAGAASAKAALDASTLFTKVTGYTELIWYANPPEGDRIGQGPPIGPPSHGLISGGESPIPIPHSKLSFVDDPGVASAMSLDDTQIRTVIVHYAWEEIGDLLEHSGADPTTTPEIPADAEVPPGTPAIIEDATGAGSPGSVGQLGTQSPETFPLVGPLRALLNLLPVSRGETVVGEKIGSGDPAVARQEFTLARTPLTYLADSSPTSTDGYRSTLRIHVDGIEWHEVPSFYGQPHDARVFVTFEDDDQRTHVRFGDGESGARLPAGVANVVADYRVGSGAAVPPIGGLTTILRPQPGLASIRNPIAPGGGADPDPPEQLRRYAPRSVLTFGRAVSGDDYEVLAAQTPGVQRARAIWAWDADAQRTLVKVLVGDDDAAVTAARAALRAFADPNRPVVVALAAPVYPDLSLTLEVDPDHEADAVRAAVAAALLDPDTPPFGTNVVRIGAGVYDSEIYDACLRVPGVVAVHGLAFRRTVPALIGPRRRPPGFSGIFQPGGLSSQRLLPGAGERHAPGDEHYFLLRAEQLHISTAMVNRG